MLQMSVHELPLKTIYNVERCNLRIFFDIYSHWLSVALDFVQLSNPAFFVKKKSGVRGRNWLATCKIVIISDRREGNVFVAVCACP